MSRTIVIDTVDHGPVEIVEQPWCIGHAAELGGLTSRDDITHNSVRVKAGADTDRHGWLPMMHARISWAPFRELVPIVSVVLDVENDFAAEDVPHVMQGLADAIRRLDQVATEAIRLRGEIT